MSIVVAWDPPGSAFCRAFSSSLGAGRSLLADAPDYCPHGQSGSLVADPPLLRSLNGVLEVDFSYRTSMGSNGYPKFCYLTPNDTQSPTLYLDIGDILKVNLKNDLSSSVNITSYAVEGKLPSNFSACSASADTVNLGSTSFHFHGMEVPPVCNGDQVRLLTHESDQSSSYSA